MFRLYVLPLLFCTIVLTVGTAHCLMTTDIQAGVANDTWQDPFYSGPFGVRTWTDLTGNHRVEGRFVELLPEKVVRLQRPDGRFLRINLDELSRADRELVRQITGK